MSPPPTRQNQPNPAVHLASWAQSPAVRRSLVLRPPHQANKFIPGPELIQMEPAEAVEKLRLAIRVLANFKQFYFEYRSKSLVEAKDNPWKFQNSSLFQRLDGYLERSHDMMDMMVTCTQFNKLERVEIGGTKGRVLTNGIKAIHADFTAAVERFKVRGV